MSRRRWAVAIVAVIVVVIVAVAGTVFLRNIVYLPLGDGGAAAIHDSASLPARIDVCGRSWSKDALDRRFTMAEIIEQSGGRPTLVDTWRFAPCPSGACTATAGGPCATVIFVRVDEDAYVDYSLQGGP